MSWLLLAVSFAFLVLVAGAVSVYLQTGVVGVVIGVVVACAMTFSAYWSSDKVALAATRAQPASIEQFGQLHNIVEGLSIAAGIPKPRVYVVDDPAPNAFATGRDPDHAAIAVTTGLLRLMNRTELEGVIAHELSHVRNYDIRVSTIAVATAGAIAIIADIFWRMMWFGGARRRGNDNGGNPIALIGLIIVIVLAPVAATLIKAAVSRRREALADATAVELTRYPTGLRQALEKLATNTSVVQHTSHATAHLWIESPLERGRENQSSKLNSLFDTHPPLAERIAALRELEGIDAWDGSAPDTPGGLGVDLGGVTGAQGAGAGAAAARGPQGSPNQPPPGWYDDPAGQHGTLRFWDGSTWTDQVRPA
ncbi:M48 family metalloprotease [Actinomarinicola tropica]|uniref:Protease HtpX homolog n=2 Tax=Actinomarinicola tropica TaxID=2789776 RepID=A0A5Q2RT86_9ACTN|nr:M48 family metalloprotease [Actinomarinicola tropica]